MKQFSINFLLILTVLGFVMTSNNLAANAESSNKITTVKEAQSNWEATLDKFKKLGNIQDYQVVKESPDRLTEYLMRTLVHAYIMVSRSDPDYPEFLPYTNVMLNIFGGNPDNVYWYAPVDGRYSYRIFGNRGTVHEVNFLIGNNFMGLGPKPEYGQTFHGSYLDDYEIEQDGSFEILVSTEKPPGFTGNWMPLHQDADYIFVRNIQYKVDEIDPKMAIEKIGGPSNDKSRTVDIDKIIDDMASYFRYSAELYFLTTERPLQDGIINRLEVPDWFAAVGGSTSQIYENGIFDLRTDEALILSFKVPESCEYWNLQVSDLLLQDPDFMRYQAHLDGSIDRSDSDGVTRIVMSRQDPGVANWVDLVDLNKGYMVMRWINCDSKDITEVQKVAFDELNNHLPKDTKRVTPDERRQQVRERFIGWQMRRYW